MEHVIEVGDKIIVISEDDDTMQMSAPEQKVIDTHPLRYTPSRAAAAAPMHSLMLGWNHLAPAILKELDNYVPIGSTVTVVTEHNVQPHGTISTTYNRLTVSFHSNKAIRRTVVP